MPGHEIDLLQNVAHNLIGLVLFTQLVQLGHDLCEGTFDVADGSLRVVPHAARPDNADNV